MGRGDKPYRLAGVLTVLAAIGVALVLASPVSAATGGGTVTQLSLQTTVFELTGPEVVVQGTAVDQFSGLLNGTATMRFTAGTDQSGMTHVVVIGDCDCTVQGLTGTVHLALVLRDTTAIGGSIQGMLYAQGTSGDLATFHGFFHVAGFTYTGFYSL
jgi:uncharacterized membrane protein YkgB